MKPIYLPPPASRPLLAREVRGSGGLTFAAVLFLLVFALPAVFGALVAVVEFKAFGEVVSITLDGDAGRE